MTIHRTLYPWEDIDRLYVSRKGGRGLTSIEDSIDASIRLEDNIQKRGGRLITATRNNTDNMRTNRTTKKKQKTKMGRKTILWTFKTTNKKTLMWLKKGNLKRKTESFQTAAQNNALRTNHIKSRIDKTQQNSKCTLCGDRDETINHTSKISKLVQKEYKTRHD